MTLKEQICHALCEGFSVRVVPLGYAVKSPFRWVSGDNLVFYVRSEGGRVRLEDDGATIAELEGIGVDFSSDTRLEQLDSLLKQHNILFNQNSILFHTEWCEESEVAKLVPQFLSFLNRIQDLQMLNRDTVRNTFKDDVFLALRDRLGDDAQVEKNEVPVGALRDYKADVVVRHKSGRVAAIFAVSNEQKALEAILFSKELELNKVENVIPFLIYEDTNPVRINKRTQSRALNSDLELAVWDEGRSGAIDKVVRHVSTQAA
ncbi:MULTISPECIES: DUF1828 domain-containing protein [Rhodomicrobium]|uniref:DUF1828 domain-containing protein n=1 Tax=Rhodomicrobium TaxID=1068 RepID=UPI000B4A6F39|nr:MULTISPECIES: DUF1828 domain-containing protein [Rhodomicrobium]